MPAYGPRHAKKCFRAYTDSEGTDQPAHPRSLIRPFSVRWHNHYITKTRLYNFDPLKPHFYIVKLEFTGVDIIFLNSAQNIDCGYSLEPPRRGGFNEYPQSKFWAEIWKKYQSFSSENFQFLEVKFFLYIWIDEFS